MRTRILTFLLLMLAAPALVVAQADQKADTKTDTKTEEAAVKAALQHYLRGHATGDGAHFAKVFHPDAKLFFMRDGKLTTIPSAQYIAGASGQPPADEAQRKRSIESVQVAGNAAIATIVLDYPTVRFVDYMSMLRIDGVWMIVNKTFYADRR